RSPCTRAVLTSSGTALRRVRRHGPQPDPSATRRPAGALTMSQPITVFRARRIHTMNPARPVATHVAVREGRILGAGSLEELAGWGPHQLDERFADHVLLPGFVEGHSHLMEGALWRF